MAATNTIKVNVKWNKNTYDNVEIDLSEPPLVFKGTMFSLTGVLPEKMKVMGFKGGMLKDDADWGKCGAKDGMKVRLMGTATEAPARPDVAIKFIEDMTEEEQAKELKVYASGLQNLGNTCYLASTLQCLNVIPELKTLLKSSTASDPQGQFLKTTSALFDEMNAAPDAVAPAAFLFIFRRLFPQFAEQGENGGFKQQDAQESWGSLMSTMQTKLDRQKFAALFEGEIVEEMKCIEFPEEEPTHNITNFLMLSCNITQETQHLFAGLQSGLVGSVDKYSPSLDRNAVYSKTGRISKLPAYLVVQSVRFEWRQDTQTRTKITRDVKYGNTIDLYPMCTAELQSKLDVVRSKLSQDADEAAANEMSDFKKKKDGPTPMDTGDSEEEDFDLGSIPDGGFNTTGNYELHAVVTHMGRSANSGHYVGWVRYKDDHWLKYDDDKVSGCTTNDVLGLSGGRGDWHIGYILIYRTKNILGTTD